MTIMAHHYCLISIYAFETNENISPYRSRFSTCQSIWCKSNIAINTSVEEVFIFKNNLLLVSFPTVLNNQNSTAS